MFASSMFQFLAHLLQMEYVFVGGTPIGSSRGPTAREREWTELDEECRALFMSEGLSSATFALR